MAIAGTDPAADGHKAASEVPMRFEYVKVAVEQRDGDLVAEVASHRGKHMAIPAAVNAGASMASVMGFRALGKAMNVPMPPVAPMLAGAGLWGGAVGAAHGYAYSKGKERGVAEKGEKPGLAGPLAVGLTVPFGSYWAAHRIGRRVGHDAAAKAASVKTADGTEGALEADDGAFSRAFAAFIGDDITVDKAMLTAKEPAGASA